jgi:hypothetical protein
MSKLEEIACPCGEVFEAELWNSIDASSDPELKEALVSGEINVVCCPRCREIFHAEHFVLYHDSQNGILAFVYPSGFVAQKEHWRKKMAADFKRAVDGLPPGQSIDYEPVLLFGLDDLVELIREDDEANDESKILEYIAEDIGVGIVYLDPCKARAKKMPKIIPHSGKSADISRAEVLGGLKFLLQENPNLEYYRKLCDRVENDRAWCLDKKLIKNTKKKTSR